MGQTLCYDNSHCFFGIEGSVCVSHSQSNLSMLTYHTLNSYNNSFRGDGIVFIWQSIKLNSGGVNKSLALGLGHHEASPFGFKDKVFQILNSFQMRGVPCQKKTQCQWLTIKPHWKKLQALKCSRNCWFWKRRQSWSCPALHFQQAP